MVTGETNSQDLLIDSSFERANSNHYFLCLELAQDHISCCVIDTVDDKVILVQRESLERSFNSSDLEKFLLQDHILEEYEKVSYSWKGFPSVLIPSGLFVPEEAGKYFEISHGYIPKSLDIVEADSCGVKVVAESIAKADELIQNRFPNAIKFNNTALLLDQIQRKNRFVKLAQLFIEVDEQNSEFFLFNGANLLYHNTFKTTAPEDVLYFLANIAQQYELDLKDLNVFVSGVWPVNGEEVKLFSKYINEVQLIMGYEYMKIGMGMSSLKKQQFASLFNQYSCV